MSQQQKVNFAYEISAEIIFQKLNHFRSYSEVHCLLEDCYSKLSTSNYLYISTGRKYAPKNKVFRSIFPVEIYRHMHLI